MKKLLLALSVASLFAAPVMAEDEEGVLDMVDVTDAKATVSSTNLTILGQLVAPTCSITESTQNQTITLDSLLTTDLLEGQTKSKNFTISLERCPQVDKSVSLHLAAQPGQLDGSNLKNAVTTANGAKGVALKISHEGNHVDLSASKGNQGITENSLQRDSLESINYEFAVEYVKESASNVEIAPGLVEATLPVEVIYK